jgi:hypothetical protein
MEFVSHSDQEGGGQLENIWTATGDGDFARVQQLISAEGQSANAADESGYTPM